MTAASRPISREPLILAGILAVGLAFRVVGLGYGLPAVYNPDEIAITSRALAFATGDLNPHNFLYPTLYFYVLFGWLGAFFVGASIFGVHPDVAAFQTAFFTDPTNVYLAGRFLSVVCGLATIVLLFLLARRLFDGATGLLAAWFLAVSPVAVRDAHYVKHDVPVTLIVVVALVAIARVWPGRAPPAEVPARTAAAYPGHGSHPNLLAASIAGAACGVATSTHYYAVFVVVPLAVALLWRARDWRLAGALRAGIAAGVAAVIAFFACSPFLLVELDTAWRDIAANRAIVMDRAVAGGGAFGSVPAYLRLLWTEAVGWPVVVAAGCGALLAGLRRPKLVLLLVSFPVVFLLFIGNTVPATRYLNPVLPFVALFAAVGVSETARSVAPRRRPLAAVALGVALTWPALVLSARTGWFFNQTDTRTLARDVIEQEVPAGSTVLLQVYTVQLAQTREALREALEANLGSVDRASRKFQIRLALDPPPGPAYRTRYLGAGLDPDLIYVSYDVLSRPDALEALRRDGVQYVVLRRSEGDADPVPERFWQLLEVRGWRLAQVSPYRDDASAGRRVRPFLHNTDTPLDPALERPGPVLEIWRLP